jgi:multimeric flavodoxin WrbA
MTRFLLISGSPRKGNTEFVLHRIFESLDEEKDIVLLREKNILRCTGCLSCDKTKKCVLKDDSEEINNKLSKADVIILGSPNYFDNVSGLLKDFIDRTNPFYETDVLKDKKLFAIMVGGGKLKNLKKAANHAIKYFAEAHKMHYLSCYCFKAINPKDLQNNKKSEKMIQKVISDIKSKI